MFVYHYQCHLFFIYAHLHNCLSVLTLFYTVFHLFNCLKVIKEVNVYSENMQYIHYILSGASIGNTNNPYKKQSRNIVAIYIYI